jgi:hypothetical protein
MSTSKRSAATSVPSRRSDPVSLTLSTKPTCASLAGSSTNKTVRLRDAISYIALAERPLWIACDPGWRPLTRRGVFAVPSFTRQPRDALSQVSASVPSRSRRTSGA